MLPRPSPGFDTVELLAGLLLPASGAALVVAGYLGQPWWLVGPGGVLIALLVCAIHPDLALVNLRERRLARLALYAGIDIAMATVLLGTGRLCAMI